MIDLELPAALHGCTLSVTNDPDYPGFYSVYADRAGAGAEIAGKIGERAVADVIAAVLQQMLPVETASDREERIARHEERQRARRAPLPPDLFRRA